MCCVLSLLEGSEVLDLFLIEVDILQLLRAFSPVQRSIQSQPSGDTSELRQLLWLQRLPCWSQDSHLPKSLRNKIHQKENTSLGCWWFLEENLIFDQWFGFQHFACTDFIAVEMRHLVTLANTSLALGRCCLRKSHLSLVQKSSAPQSLVWYFRQRSLGSNTTIQS